MRVILRKEVENLGEVGDVVEVADGYGMNHLIPKGIALHATAHSERAAQHEQMLREAQIQAAKRGSEEEARKFEGVELEFTLRAGEDGRLFGSVTNRDIEAALAEKDLIVSRRKIILEEPIKRVGEFPVSIRLHPEVRAEVKVHVLADQSAPPEGEAPEAGASPEAEASAEAPEAGADAGEATGSDQSPGAEASSETSPEPEEDISE